MEDIEVKKVEIKDVEELLLISRQTFSQAFAATNSAGDMQKYLDTSFNMEKLSRELKNPDSEFYFASSDDKVAGYLKVNFNGSDRSSG